MKKKLVVGIGAAVLMYSLVATQVFAATDIAYSNGSNPSSMGGLMEGFHEALTDEQKAEIAAEKAEREEKLEAFVASLSAEQKALYEAMTPAHLTGTEQPEQYVKPDETAITSMKEAYEAFIESLSEEQKTEYDQLFSGRGQGQFGGMDGGRQELTDEQKAEMETAMAGREEELKTFVASLSAEQKALYDAMLPSNPAEGGQPQMPDQTMMTEMKEAREAFMASLSEKQKAEYDAFYGNMGHRTGRNAKGNMAE